MKRLLPWMALLLILLWFALSLAHIGSSWLWTAVLLVAIALNVVAWRMKPRAAGRR